MSELIAKLKYLTKRKSFIYGVPFLLLMVAGSFGLKQFSILRYQYAKIQPVSPEDMKKYGITMKRRGQVTLETEYNKIQGIDIEHWENKRGPRPWEETTNNGSP